MTKQFHLLSAILFLISIISCSKSDDNSIDDSFGGEIFFDEEGFTINQGFILRLENTEDPGIFIVHLSDGLWMEDKEGVHPHGNTSILLRFTIKSTNSEIQAGEYEEANWFSKWPEGNVHFGASLDLFVNDLEYELDHGSISIAGESPELTLDFDLHNESNQALTGSVSGFFYIIDAPG